MPRRSELGSIASGLLHSFVSRNNDLDGYWGLGVLYLYAKKVGELKVTIDISSDPLATAAKRLPRIHLQPNFEALIGHYRTMLHAVMTKRGIPESWVTEAAFIIEFESQDAEPSSPRIGENSEAFACRLSIKDDLGRVHVLHADGWCWPHNPRREMKSARD